MLADCIPLFDVNYLRKKEALCLKKHLKINFLKYWSREKVNNFVKKKFPALYSGGYKVQLVIYK